MGFKALNRQRDLVTERNIEYMKAIYKLGGRPGGCIVRVGDLARVLGVSASTVSIMIRRLQYKGLVNVTEGQGVCLSRKGLQVLTEYIWKHAIIELVMVRAGIDSETARMMARKLAASLSTDDAWTIAKALGVPKACPHGKLIPYPGTLLDPLQEYCGLE